MEKLGPIFTADLFSQIDGELINLLKSLSLDDWDRPTVAPLWKVKDVAAHLLDGNIRGISILRDSFFGVKAEGLDSYQDMVGFLNKLNADWVNAFKRASPASLIELLEFTGKKYCEIISNLNPFEEAPFSVAWAGEEKSFNWFHIAREYTEKWHHQQQIRLAVSREEDLYCKKYYWPYLETSMRALPHHYRDIKGRSGDLISFTITGDGGGTWLLYSNGDNWSLIEECDNKPVAHVEIDGTVAWRIFTKGIKKSDAQANVVISGKTDLGEKIFDMLAVMA